ncbi:MAG: DUF116 domain-containing protein [Candidatus Aenigmarchaeota archaeon]|nr:DUF116 domain-containing protein [Candidatus Aenigmarchaeota archaeon]
MYEFIGKIIIWSGIAALSFILVALAVGYFSLKKKMFFCGFFARILDFFYMPLKPIYALFSDTRNLDALMVSLKNKAHYNKFAKSKKRVIFAPHCLRHIKCPAPSTKYGIQCISCGLCPFSEIKKKCNEKGYDIYIIQGSAAIKNIIKNKMKLSDGVLGIGCTYELNKMARFLDMVGIAGYGVALTKDGCFNTKVNVSDVYRAMNIK